MRADKKGVSRLLKTARGQIDGILKMIENDHYCIDVLNQILACEAVLKRASKDVLHEHISGCVAEAFQENDLDAQKEKMDEIAVLLDKLAK